METDPRATCGSVGQSRLLPRQSRRVAARLNSSTDHQTRSLCAAITRDSIESRGRTLVRGG